MWVVVPERGSSSVASAPENLHIASCLAVGLEAETCVCSCCAAGLQYMMDSTTQGFQLSASGYSHKLPELIRKVVEQLADLEVKADRFEVSRSALICIMY